MIQTEDVTLGGVLCVRTYSDAGYYIERDGHQYEEAIDPVGTGRTYTETSQLIETELDPAEALEELREALV